jgi:hypothetical protein
VAVHTYYTFTMDDAIQGLERALRDAGVEVTQTIRKPEEALVDVRRAGVNGSFRLVEGRTKEHPLARLGPISYIAVTPPEHWNDMEPILTLAFLRGGG